MKFTKVPRHVEAALSRRGFLQGAGMLVVGFAVPSAKAQANGPYPDPNFRQLDSWIVIHQDNTATFYVGKTDCGQGTGRHRHRLIARDVPAKLLQLIELPSLLTFDVYRFSNRLRVV